VKKCLRKEGNLMKASKNSLGSVVSLATIMLVGGVVSPTAHAAEWQVTVGAESSGRETQALAFFPNELWIQAGDSIHFTFPTHERHTLSLLKPGQIRPAGFGSTFGVLVGRPGVTPSWNAIFDGSTCLTSDVFPSAPCT
jgi:plastocyanin